MRCTFRDQLLVLPLQKNNLTFRSGHYTGRGWDVQEYAQLLKEGVPNYGNQLGWYMVRHCS